MIDFILESFWDTLETLNEYEYKTKNSKLKLPILLDNSKFIPKEITTYIKTKYKSSFKISTILNGICYTLYFHGTKNDIQHILINIDLIIITIQFIQSFAVIEIPEKVNIYIYMTPFKKEFPVYNFVMKPKHVNTGVTELYEKHRNIVIFRKEEWYKVFIHELCHTFCFDKNIKNNDALRKIYNIKSNLYYGESYTEFWATILLCVFTSYTKNETCTDYIKDTKENIDNEISFSLIQANKVLNHMYLHYNALIEENKHLVNISTLHAIYFKEETNVFCYYVLKLVFLFFYEEFINICVKKNENIFTVNNDFIVNFIYKYYKHKLFIDSLYDFSNEKKHFGLKMTQTYLI